ncbi:NUDIX domain-containing protein [Marinitenerispora sediminis]|uniref:NUDIX hydrolase n=1 Tax=Marinitenerispora sediminis TaxID=1931232 RepID=A0A368TA22_9ACTN|nr:NUDIX hydrolase [Marinitenerispora sediminis]RCV51662.1 NUDIX hydrolase [Marinitenerispora sediminis]RCV59460.1 NUDIX hydrolase [Marinitenerispora sediminis]RCV61697.1 NUDIX hydrolase [Marinitenerispora sediminis]
MSGTVDYTVADHPESWTVEDTAERFRSPKVAMRSDWVRMPGSGGRTEVVQRDLFVHPGAVAVVALDDAGRVLLLRQYRHAVGHQLWELPAGMRDVDGEPPVRTAQRELLEEAGYRAATWHELADVFPSPGFSTERVIVYLARNLTEVPAEEIDFERVHEEADMPLEWMPLEDAVRAVLTGRLHNASAVIGILAAQAAVRDGLSTLRPALA